MTIKVLDQTPGKTVFLNDSSPDDVINVGHERVRSKVLGRVVPVTRINYVNSITRPYTVEGCTDGCAIPGETTETVRIVISTPVVNKTQVIAKLELMVAQLKSDAMANVWLGLPPSSTAELTSSVGV